MNFKTKLLGVAVLPVILISLATFFVIDSQTHNLAQTQIAEIEQNTMAAKRAELIKMNQLALSAIRGLYEDTTLPQHVAQQRAKAVLKAMAFGEDGYFFVYDEKGNNIVHPRLPALVGKNWWDLQDPNGDFVIRNLINIAKSGGGFHNYVWNKPSTGLLTAKIGHAVFLDRWNWMIGTGLYTDDVRAEVAAMRGALETSINRTTSVLLVLSVAAVLLAALFTYAIRLSEQKFADQRLKDLTHRIVEVQEDERKRVSTELHDGISQLLVSARYGLDQAMAKAGNKTSARPALKKSMQTIEAAISEVRRISMALRPSVLDDIGLAAAIASLGREVADGSGFAIHVRTQRVGDRLSTKPQTALYRVAQEALTNITKHANAKNVWLSLDVHNGIIKLTIEDDGPLKKIITPQPPDRLIKGMGLRNMRERMDAFHGTLDISTSIKGGLLVVAQLPCEETPNSQSKNVARKRFLDAA